MRDTHSLTGSAVRYWATPMSNADKKAVVIVGTGDFVHPGWLKELKAKLEPAEPGLFKLKKEFSRTLDHALPAKCQGEVRFHLACEISNIYKRDDKVRKDWSRKKKKFLFRRRVK